MGCQTNCPVRAVKHGSRRDGVLAQPLGWLGFLRYAPTAIGRSYCICETAAVTDPIEPVLVSVTRTVRDHRRSVRASRRTQLWRMRIAAALLLVGGGLVVVTGGAFLNFLGLPLCVVALVLLVWSWLLPWRIVRALPPAFFVSHQIEVNSEGVHLRGDDLVDAHPWPTFASARRARHVWILRHRDQGPSTMFARRYFTADQEARLEAMLRAHGLLA